MEWGDGVRPPDFMLETLSLCGARIMVLTLSLLHFQETGIYDSFLELVGFPKVKAWGCLIMRNTATSVSSVPYGGLQRGLKMNAAHCLNVHIGLRLVTLKMSPPAMAKSTHLSLILVVLPLMLQP